MEIRFDATIDNEDLANINWIRFYINAALSRIPDAPQKRSKGSIMISIQNKAVEYQDKIREAMDKLLFKGTFVIRWLWPEFKYPSKIEITFSKIWAIRW